MRGRASSSRRLTARGWSVTASSARRFPSRHCPGNLPAPRRSRLAAWPVTALRGAPRPEALCPGCSLPWAPRLARDRPTLPSRCSGRRDGARDTSAVALARRRDSRPGVAAVDAAPDAAAEPDGTHGRRPSGFPPPTLLAGTAGGTRCTGTPCCTSASSPPRSRLDAGRATKAGGSLSGHHAVATNPSCWIKLWPRRGSR